MKVQKFADRRLLQSAIAADTLVHKWCLHIRFLERADDEHRVLGHFTKAIARAVTLKHHGPEDGPTMEASGQRLKKFDTGTSVFSGARRTEIVATSKHK